jgi:aminopeptidase-like protein
MRRQVIAGYNVTCVGDDRAFSFLPSRHGDSLADRAARHVLGHLHPDYVPYTYLDRGSDERQYCAPGIDLPVASVMRSKYGTYPEYHTSLDDLEVVTPAGLQGAFDVLQRCIECIEGDERLGVTVLGEPHLQKHGLYPSRPDLGPSARDVLNVIAYCDGRHSLLDVAETTGIPMWDVLSIAELLRERDLLAPVEHDDRA